MVFAMGDASSWIQWIVSGIISTGAMLLTLRYGVKRLDEKLTDALAQVKEMRADIHSIRTESHSFQTKHAVLEFRVKTIEKKLSIETDSDKDD
jgi:hypothetical protein